MFFRKTILIFGLATAALLPGNSVFAQLVGLPLPRLLTLMPMGGQAGTTVEVTLTGENIESVTEMIFSTPKMTAKPATDKAGKVLENKFVLTIAPDTPVGVYDARVMSRLGISSPRAFTVGRMDEVSRTVANNSIETAMALKANSICNAMMTTRMIDFYSFKAKKGKRVVIECAAVGIDSRLTPVVIVADSEGSDLLVNRTGGVIDFTPEADGDYLIKVNDLTYQGGARHFYRLALQEVPEGVPAPLQPSTQMVSSMTWPPVGLAPYAPGEEAEPNDAPDKAQKITLPCDLSGSFFPAADVDTYEFSAKKGEVWWVEIGSERLGLSTDPFVLVQKVTVKDGKETLTDVAELYDINSPVKVSSNGYSYDGPPYNVGSPDVLQKVEIKEDGIHRIQIRDLFGGTRNDPANKYRLIVRKAVPDFDLSAWALHMGLRNGDRAAFSKPIALRAGASMMLEVIAVRRDGFDGEIELKMDGLPAGVTASGLKIAKGKSVGHIVITANEKAKRTVSFASISGSAKIGDAKVTRPCHLATMEWPVKNAKSEIPSPRLVGSIPVSVSDSEMASLSIAASENKVWEATEGEKLTIPLKAIWRDEFSGTAVKLKVHGAGFEKAPALEIPLKKETDEAVFDLAALKVPPGEYTVVFYGGAITKYRYNPDAVKMAEAEQKKAAAEAAAFSAKAKKMASEVTNAPTDKKTEVQKAAKLAAEQQKQAEAEMAKAIAKMKAVTKAAAPKDIVDIVVSEPIRISVKAKPVAPAPAAKAKAGSTKAAKK